MLLADNGGGWVNDARVVRWQGAAVAYVAAGRLPEVYVRKIAADVLADVLACLDREHPESGGWEAAEAVRREFGGKG